MFRSTSIVGLLTLLSRITGLLRDVVYARMFPIGGGVMDAFLVAYQIPNTLRRLFAEGAFSQAFVPVVTQYRTQHSTDEVRELVDSTTGTLGLVVFVVSLLGVIAAPVLILVLGPGFNERGTFDLAVAMLRWTFPYLFFVSLTALAAGVLNSYGRFALPALTSVALNVIAIIFAAWIAPLTANPGVTLAMGVFVAGVIQLAMQIPALRRLQLLRRPYWNWQHEGVKRIARLMLPAILGSSMGQISVLLSSSIATMLATGSVAWLYFADRLVEFPLGVFSIALATVILPHLSAQHAQATPDLFAATLDRALRLLLVIVIPAAVALWILAGPLTVVLFHYGQFTARDVAMTQAALEVYTVALLGWSLVKVLAPGFYARQDTRTPMRAAVISLSLTIALNVLFLGIAAATGRLLQPGLHVYLAATTAAGALLNAGLLYHGLQRSSTLRPSKGWPGLLLRIVLASAAMAGMLYWLADSLNSWLVLSGLMRAARCALCIAAGLGVYFLALGLMGTRPRDFAQRGTSR
jgi:putative peptidoglycan lipid II flippase